MARVKRSDRYVLFCAWAYAAALVILGFTVYTSGWQQVFYVALGAAIFAFSGWVAWCRR